MVADEEKPRILVLLRHGESVWNRDGRFTGWVDVDLTEKGVGEARAAGKVLKDRGYAFDIAFTSVLKRAVQSVWNVLDEMNMEWVQIENAWQLNERHYGALQGLSKEDVRKQYGDEQFSRWRRGYAERPPALEKLSPMDPRLDPKYADVDERVLPIAESLKDACNRVIPYWVDHIAPMVKDEKRVLISCHGNTIRALVKHLDGISDEAISGHNIPTGIPLIYELDRDLHTLRSYYLGDEEHITSALEHTKNEGK